MEYTAHQFFPQPYADDYGFFLAAKNTSRISLEGMNRLIRRNDKPTVCACCNSGVRYIGMGKYECECCHEIYLDDLGRVRQAMESAGHCSMEQLSKYSGVSPRKIRDFIENGFISVA